MTKFALDRLFQDSLTVGLERNGLAAAATGATATYSPELRREISAVIAEVIKAETRNDGIEIEEEGSTRAVPEQLHSEILRIRSQGITQKIFFLRIKDATIEAIVPLVSMALSASHGGVTTAVVPGLQVVTNLWKNLVTLKRETDSIAIDVFEALVAERAAKHAAKEGPPTTQEIAGRVHNKSISEVVTALKRLSNLKLIEIARWGGAGDDMSDSGNSWKVRL